ncbi:leucyl aminopeptidase [Candidatus Uhrbacteria bacterium]|nr:leucyl aminopeptidase [Candidatus Uhrbacteria bacterium]
MQWFLHAPKQPLTTSLLIVPVFQSDRAPKLPKECATVAPVLEMLWRRKELSGKQGEMMLLPTSLEHIHRLLLVGLGALKTLTDRDLQNALGAAFKTAGSKPINDCAVVVPSVRTNPGALASMLGIAAHRALYHFKKYKTEKKDATQSKQKKEPDHVITSITLVGVEARKQKIFQRELETVEILAPFLSAQRDWGNMPANECTPEFLASRAMDRAKSIKNLSVTVFDKEQIKKHGMGGLYGVSRGATEHPRFIILEYWGRAKQYKPFVFVGKGITFDSGGISIKPSEKMHEMKFDMLGAAAVINAMSAIASLKLPVNVVGLTPCTENVPSGEAYKPGDILRAMNGSTMEILNTDAEGRVILSDALSFAHSYAPSAVVDLATLTGAALVVLGHEGTPMVSNNDAVAAMVEKAGQRTNDRLWRLPLWQEFKEAVKSEIADVRNSTDGFGGGTITGAAFLEHFVRPLPWAHLDIAGTAWYTSPKPWMITGATDMGVQLLVEVAKQWKAVKKQETVNKKQ